MKNLKLFVTGMILFTAGLLMSCTGSGTKSLEGTSWKGMANIPEPNEIVLKFTKTHCEAYLKDAMIESMKYTQKGKDIHFEKVSGGSPCAVGSEGDYTFEITGDKIHFTSVDDKCVNRVNTFKEAVFTGQN